jgi:hypothetical protein
MDIHSGNGDDNSEHILVKYSVRRYEPSIDTHSEVGVSSSFSRVYKMRASRTRNKLGRIGFN